MKQSRREFTKMAALFGAAALGRQNAKAQSHFGTTMGGPVEPLESKTLIKGKAPLLWIDGIYFDKFKTADESFFDTRANVAILLREKQTSDSYVVSVYFTKVDSNSIAEDGTVMIPPTSLGFRYFTPDDKMKDGSPPYIVLNSVDISIPVGSSFVFRLYYAIRSQTEDSIYQVTFKASDLFRSRLSNNELIGVQMQADPARRLDTSAGSGGIANAIFYRSAVITNDLVAIHQLDAKLISLNGDQFTVRTKVLHTQTTTTSKSHFSRYFLVTDPVGRIVGYSEKKI